MRECLNLLLENLERVQPNGAWPRKVSTCRGCPWKACHSTVREHSSVHMNLPGLYSSCRRPECILPAGVVCSASRAGVIYCLARHVDATAPTRPHRPTLSGFLKFDQAETRHAAAKSTKRISCPSANTPRVLDAMPCTKRAVLRAVRNFHRQLFFGCT